MTIIAAPIADVQEHLEFDRLPAKMSVASKNKGRLRFATTAKEIKVNASGRQEPER